jgi:hypothetical protein
MKHIVVKVSIINTLLFLFSAILTAQDYKELWKNDNRAVIVVTGLKITTEAKRNEITDLSVGEDALVSVSDKNDKTWEKTTQIFNRPFGTGETFYSADFPLAMDSVYTISMRFKSGTVITIDDYKIESSWKTHHYFHSTDGKKSPATVLRKEQDNQSGLWCYIYSLYPLSNYITSGGAQVK